MILLAGIVLHSMLIATQQKRTVEFRVTRAFVSYEAEETNLGSSLKTVIGRNDELNLDLLTSPESVQAKLLISSSGFKTDRPMRDWSVRTLYLKSSQYPEITFALLKIDGEPIASVLHSANQTMVLKTSPQNATVTIRLPDKDNAPLVVQVGKERLLAEGRLKEDILNALHSDTGKMHITGRLTVAGGSKDFDTVVSFQRTGNTTFALSTAIDARFTDFGMTAPDLAWFIAVHNHLVLRGYAIIEVLR